MCGWATLTAFLFLPQLAHPLPDVPLGPLVVHEPRGGPRVIHHPLRGSSLVALRLSVPVTEPAGYAGASRTLQELLRDRLERGAEPLGALAELSHSPGHAVYSLVGPVDELDAMAELLRDAVGPPPLAPGQVRAAKARVERAGHALSELPDRRVRADLWSSLFPGAPAGGANAVPGPLASSHLEWLWRRFYRPSAMSVVVVGEVPDTVIRSIFADWPTPPEPGPPPSLRPVQGGTAEVQTNAAWVGLGRAARTGESGALAAAAELVAARLRAGGIAAAEAEVWWGPGRTALVVLGSALPDAPAASPESIRATIADLAADVTADLVAEAQRTLRRRLLYQARTARGLAAVIGTFHERTGAPDGAARFLDALDRVDAKAVGRILRALVERPDAVLEIGPQ